MIRTLGKVIGRLRKTNPPIAQWEDCGNTLTDDGRHIQLKSDDGIIDALAKYRKLSALVLLVVASGALLKSIPIGGATVRNIDFTMWWIFAMICATLATVLFIWSPHKNVTRPGTWTFDRLKERVVRQYHARIPFDRIVAISLDVQTHEQTGAKEFRLDLCTDGDRWHGPVYVSLSLTAALRVMKYISDQTGIHSHDFTLEPDQESEPDECHINSKA